MRKLIPAVFAVLAAGASHALGFGDLILHSALNQPLDARVDLLAVKPSERDSVEVRMADAASFERFGVSRSPALDDVRVEVISLSDKSRIRVRLSTEQPVREPFLTFLLEADWNGGRALREYTVLLDPPVETPVARASAPSRRAPAPAAAPERRSAAPEPAAGREETRQARRSPTPAGTVGVSRYGPIARNETLWSIARELRPDSRVSMNQMQLAIYRANPQAFNGNINRLMAGATLTIPEADEIRAIDQAAARREVIEQQRQHENFRRGTRNAPDSLASGVSSDTSAAEEEARALRLEPPSDDLVAEENARESLDAAEADESGDEAPADTPVATAQSLAESGLAAAEAEAGETEADTDTEADDGAMESAGSAEGEDSGTEESTGVAGDTAKPKAVVPEGSGLPLSARNILLTLAVLLVAAVAFVWMRRRRYEPISEDFGPRVETRAEPAMEPAAEVDKPPSLTPEEREEAVAEVLGDVDGYIQLELYDEALAALEVGLEKCPGDPALQHKVLEVHHANGDRDAFVDAAARYFPEPDDTDPEWWAVAAMGRELAPDESRFADVPVPGTGDDRRAGEEDARPEPEEPESPAQDSAQDSAAADDEETATPDSPAEKTGSDLDLDFDLDGSAVKEDKKPADTGERTDALPPALDVDLSQFQTEDKDDDEDREEAEKPEPAAEEPEEETEDEFGDLDLDSLSLDTDEGKIDKPEFEAGEGASGPAEEESVAEPDDAEPETEEAPEAESDTADAELDEVTTNLDLARAYLDMGEPDMARSLLQEVKDQGNAEQRREAEELLERAG